MCKSVSMLQQRCVKNGRTDTKKQLKRKSPLSRATSVNLKKRRKKKLKVKSRNKLGRTKKKAKKSSHRDKLQHLKDSSTVIYQEQQHTLSKALLLQAPS